MADDCKTFKDHSIDLCKSMIVGIFLATSAAGITHHYQNKDADLKVVETARDNATATFKKTIRAIGKRHYYALRAAIGFQYKIEQDERWKNYDDVVKDWNENRYENLADIKRYFGPAVEEKIYELIKKFNNIHQQLTKAKNQFKDKQPVDDLTNLLEQQIYPMDDEISNFSNDLQEQLREGNVDVYRPVPPMKK